MAVNTFEISYESYEWHANVRRLLLQWNKWGRRRQRWEALKMFRHSACVFISKHWLWSHRLFVCLFVCLFVSMYVFFFLKFNRLISVSSWTEILTLVLEMLTTFQRRLRYGAVEVWFENRTAQMPALFNIFLLAAFVLCNQSYYFCRRCHGRPFCLNSSNSLPPPSCITAV